VLDLVSAVYLASLLDVSLKVAKVILRERARRRNSTNSRSKIFPKTKKRRR